MKIKKILAVTATCAVLSSMLIVGASAHGHGGGHRAHRSNATYYPVCTVEDCATAGAHTHDGTTYCGYANCSNGCGGHYRRGHC